MRKWRHNIGHLSIDLQDGDPHLLGSRFADVILIFAETANDFLELNDILLECLKEIVF